ncbi:MAG: hypothetical protein M3O61_13825 [Gemmatimonadota bacterium]|nr:hypothetical protein [Gemmatimonadota bacterium]
MKVKDSSVAVEERHLLNQLPDRFGFDTLAPQLIAPFLLPCIQMPGVMSTLAAEVSQRLLDMTVRQAIAQTEFYSARFADLPLQERLSRADFQSLPVLTRNELQASGGAIRSRHAKYAFTSYTSGTSTGRPLFIDRSQQEQQYLTQLFTLLGGPSEAGEAEIALVLATWYHGHQLQIPGRAFTVPVSLSNRVGYGQALALLSRSYDINGSRRHINAIVGGLVAIMMLTVYLLEEDRGDLITRVKRLQSTSHYISRAARAWLSEQWKCPLEDCFSLTELFFGATYCQDCDLYHFDPFGLAEVLKPGTSEVTEEGRGILLLTGFYPFTQMTPLIRYECGDLVDVHETSCVAGTRGYRFLGRKENAVFLDGRFYGDAWLSAAEVIEALEPLAEIGRARAVGDLPKSAANVGGMPKFRLSKDKDGRPLLEIELRFLPAQFPQRVAELRTRVLDGLRDECSWLGASSSREWLQVSFIGPDMLAGDVKFRP